VVLGEVDGLDLERRRVLLGLTADGASPGKIEYDSLVVAAGASHS